MTTPDAKHLLLNCYWDGMTLGEATTFIARCYQETPTPRQIKIVQDILKGCTGKEWRQSLQRRVTRPMGAVMREARVTTPWHAS